eukprot:TRINITY_DN4571_c0_g1_i1.p1 TRINITY_DN4571_c0_g1~~TRINITY_DN4571_c0_g1_i1.p1  ORF type:complete len:1426 (+),score=312.14 TRINITY_DN4571_c0_g1_i1:885-5162(+)
MRHCIRSTAFIVHQEETDVLSFSVQLFTAKGLSLAMAGEAGLFEHITESALKALSFAILHRPIQDSPTHTEVPLPPSLDLRHVAISKKYYWNAITDLRYVLQRPEFAETFLFNCQPALTTFLRAASLLQGLDATMRELHEHVPFVSNVWVRAVQLITFDFLPLVDMIREGMTRGNGEGACRVLRECVQALREWVSLALRITPAQGQGQPQSEDDFPRFDCVTGPYSLHLPLHRLFICLLRQALVSFGVSLNDILVRGSRGEYFPLLLVDHPLQVQSLLAQVRCGMWRRNGDPIHRHAFFFRSNVTSADINFSNDLLCIQTAAVTLDPACLLSLALRRFCLELPGSGVWWCAGVRPLEQVFPPGIDVPRYLSLLEDLLALVVTAVCDRTRCGTASPEERLRRTVVNVLCVADQTHSQLESCLLPANVRGGALEGTLTEVATLVTVGGAAGVEEQKYQLRPECWDEWDPYFARLSAREASLAEERYFQVKKKQLKRQPQQLQLQRTLPVPRLLPTMPAYQQLPRLLHSYVLHGLIFAALHNAARGGDVTDRLLQLAIHLLSLSLDTLIFAPAESVHASFHTPASLSFPSATGLVVNVKHAMSAPPSAAGDSIITLLVELAQNPKFSEHAAALTRVARRFAELDTECRAYVDSALGSDAQQPTASAARARHIADVKARQQALMLQFAAQQRAFAERNAGEESAVIAEADDVKVETCSDGAGDSCGDYVCVMCRERICKGDTERPFGFIANIQRSPLLNFVMREDCARSPCVWHPPQEPAVAPPPLPPALDCVRPVYESTGTFVSCCSHVMHRDCFCSYILSLHRRLGAGDTNDGHGFLSVLAGEFCCPACRKMANSLLPALSPDAHTAVDAGSIDTVPAGTLVDAFALQHGAEAQVVAQARRGESDALAVADFARHVFAERHLRRPPEGSGLGFAPAYLTNALATTIASLELTARGRCPLPEALAPQLRNQLRCLAEAAAATAALAYGMSKAASASDALLGTLPELSPLLHDPFTLLAHAMCVCPDNLRQEQLGRKLAAVGLAVEMVKALLVLQSSKSVPAQLTSLASFASLAAAVGLPCVDDDLRERVAQRCLPYLRRTALLLHTLHATWEAEPPPADGSASACEDYRALARYVRVDSPPSLLLQDTTQSPDAAELVGAPLVSLWLAALRTTQPAARPAPEPVCEPQPEPESALVEPTELHAPAPINAAQHEEGTEEEAVREEGEQEQDQDEDDEEEEDQEEEVGEETEEQAIVVFNAPLRQFRLMELPSSYMVLFQQYSERPCSRCGVRPREPALCLCCGAVLCAHVAAAPESPREERLAALVGRRLPGECNAHAYACCLRGVGAFLIVRQAVVLVLVPLRQSGCHFRSLYIDSHHEEDPGLLRGKPLFLDGNRYAQLHALITTHEVYNACLYQSQLALRPDWLAF